MRRHAFAAAFAASTTMALAGGAVPALSQEFVPDKDVNFVIPFGAGGGSDVLARTIATTLKKENLVPTNVIVENRPGGSGAIGYNYLAGRKGDPYALGTVSVSFFTTPLLGASPVSLADFTPVAAIAMSPYILIVPAASEIKSIADFTEGRRLTTGTVGVVSDAALLSRMLQASTKTTIDPVPFDGEGEVLSALLGQHIDFMWGNPGEIGPQIEAGLVRAIAVSTPERLTSLKDIPTMKESGHDIVHVQLRGIVMPKDVDQAAVDYWTETFRKLSESATWKADYLDRFKDEPRFLGQEEFAAELQRTNDLYKGMMAKAGPAN